MAQISYETVDVFAKARFGGNPLAVIADARGLSSEAMQSIAREFNTSETTFVVPPEDPRNTARVRVFTPANEIPFAGHPNVGTAFVLARLGTVFGRDISGVMRFEEEAGLVEVEILRRDGEVVGARIQAPQPFEIGEEIAPSTIAACASLEARDVTTEHHRPVFASVGLPFALAELRSIEALGRATPNAAAFRDAHQRYPSPVDRFSLFLYARAGEARVRARMFAPLSMVLEDPATGSASAALGGLLSSLAPGVEPFQLAIEQGVEMARPSLIDVRVERAHGARQRILVTGHCIPVMRGVIMLSEGDRRTVS